MNSFKRRETSTTVEMRDGQSFAIAGLLQDDFRDLNGQVPWLGDIPILGALFRSADYERAQSELVIIITPHLVTPDPRRGAGAADRPDPPADPRPICSSSAGPQRRTGPPRARPAKSPSRTFGGSYGYVMED